MVEKIKSVKLEGTIITDKSEYTFRANNILDFDRKINYALDCINDSSKTNKEKLK